MVPCRVFALVLCLGLLTPAFSATITVTTLNDETNVNGLVSLREAIKAALTDTSVDGSTPGSGADTIVFSTSLVANGDANINLTLFDPGTNSYSFGPTAFRITNSVTIVGPTGDNGITIKRSTGAFRFFDVPYNARLVLQNLTFKGGIARGGDAGSGNAGGGGAAGMGGAIFSQSTVVLSRCTFTDCQAIGGRGAIGGGSNGSGGGGGMGGNGGSGGNPSGGNGGNPNGGVSGLPNGGFGGGGAGGNESSGAGDHTGGTGGNGGVGGGGGGGGYALATGGCISPPSNCPDAVGGNGGIGGFGGGGGGGGTAYSFNGTSTAGAAGNPGYGGGTGTVGKIGQNLAGGDGGGGAGMGGVIFMYGGTLSADNCTFSGNSALGGNCSDDSDTAFGKAGGGQAMGGVVFNWNGNVGFTNCTLAFNTVLGGMGSNRAPSQAGCIYVLAVFNTANVVLNNTILANTLGGTNRDYYGEALIGTLATGGSNNLIRVQTAFTGGVVSTSNPLLDVLADNRGPTRTHRLLTGSPAIDAGGDAVVTTTNDQRGGAFPRIADGNLDGVAHVDIGAYELLFVDYGDAPDTGSGTASSLDDILAGASNFRISVMGNDAETNASVRGNYGANNPAVAYNASNAEYFVVWSGDDNTAPLVDNEQEVFGQRINARTGAKVGSQFRISFMGPNGSTAYSASQPSVAWNSRSNEYLVVWVGDDSTAPLVDGEFEVFAQRVSGVGALVGGRIRVSYMGPNGDTAYGASTPDVCYNATSNEYFIVWRADDNTAPVVDNEFEIYGQRIGGGGSTNGSRIRISTQGNDAQANAALRQSIAATDPRVAWNSSNNQYLAVWSGDSDVAPMVDGENEIFGQIVNSAGGLIGANFRISFMGPNGSTAYLAANPDVAYNSASNQWLVAWEGDDNTAPLVDDEREIFARVLNSTGGAFSAQTRVSHMGADGSTSFAASRAAVAYNTKQHVYFVAWQGDNAVDNKFEIFGQRIGSTGAVASAAAISVAHGGDEDDATYTEFSPAIAYNGNRSEYLVVMNGDDDMAPLVDGENEIHGQRLVEDVVRNYNTSSSDNGPRHFGRNGIKLGALLDSEADAIPTVDADGDDTTDSDDEDGVANPAAALTLFAGQSVSATVTVENATGSSAMLYGWIDFNANGLFENATERSSLLIPNGFSGPVVLTFPVTPSYATNVTYARFRLSTDAAASNATGTAADGEVEDYQVQLQDSDGDGLLDSWEIQNFGSIDVTDGSGDYDGDHYLDRDEFGAGTVPTNSSSYLSIAAINEIATNRFELIWPGVLGKTYQILYRTNATQVAAFTNLSGIAGTSPANISTAQINNVKSLIFYLRVQ